MQLNKYLSTRPNIWNNTWSWAVWLPVVSMRALAVSHGFTSNKHQSFSWNCKSWRSQIWNSTFLRTSTCRQHILATSESCPLRKHVHGQHIMEQNFWKVVWFLLSLALGSWILVVDSWFLVFCCWLFLVPGSWLLVLSSCCLVVAPWFLILGPWLLIMGP